MEVEAVAEEEEEKEEPEFVSEASDWEDSPKRSSLRSAPAQPEAVVSKMRSRAAICKVYRSSLPIVCRAMRRVSATADVS